MDEIMKRMLQNLEEMMKKLRKFLWKTVENNVGRMYKNFA